MLRIPFRARAVAVSILILLLASCGIPPTSTPTQTRLPLPPPSPTPVPSLAPTLPPPQARDTLLLAHTMPWYQSKEVSGSWGWHWTMNHFDPDQGQIASLTTPLTGPYDSSDPHLLEYQVMLMKLTGVDGVIVDWYGSADFRDYASINRSTMALFEYARKAGLKFAICYEDQTLKHMLAENFLAVDGDLTQAQADMQFLQENFFQDPAYLTFQDRPILLVFGPQHLLDGANWQQAFDGIQPAPYLVSEDKTLWGAAASSYPWPPMWAARDGVLAEKDLEMYLENSSLYQAEQPYRLAGAFPGFDDIYQEAGVSEGYGVLDPRGGDTFRRTLDLAIANDPQAIQLITWNDYGEGTQIEPTKEDGYLYLEILQGFRRQNIQPGFAFQPEDLRLPLELYQLRKAHPGDAAVNADLDLVFERIIGGDLAAAHEILTRNREE